jgi:hypothetical protein
MSELLVPYSEQKLFGENLGDIKSAIEDNLYNLYDNLDFSDDELSGLTDESGRISLTASKDEVAATPGVCMDCTIESIREGGNHLTRAAAPGVVNHSCTTCFAEKYKNAILADKTSVNAVVQFRFGCRECKGERSNCDRCVKRRDAWKPAKKKIPVKFLRSSEKRQDRVEIFGGSFDFQYLLSKDFDEIVSDFRDSNKYMKGNGRLRLTQFTIVIDSRVDHPEARLPLNGYFPASLEGVHSTCNNNMNGLCHGASGHSLKNSSNKLLVTPPPLPAFYEKKDGRIVIGEFCLVCEEILAMKRKNIDFADKSCRICSNTRN